MVISVGPPCHSVVVNPLSPLSLSSYTHSAPTIPPGDDQLLISMGVGHGMGWVWTALVASLLGRPVVVGGGAASMTWWSSRVHAWDGIGSVIAGLSCHRAVSVTWQAYENGGALTLWVCRYTLSTFPHLSLLLFAVCALCVIQSACVGLHGVLWL